MKPEDVIQWEKHVFNKAWLKRLAGIPEQDLRCLGGMELHSYMDYRIRMMVHELVMPLIESDVLEETYETAEDYIEIPADWWHGVLDRFVPKRLKRIRKKIRYQGIVTKQVSNIKYSNICPHISVADEGDHIKFLVSDPKETYSVFSEAEYIFLFYGINGWEVLPATGKRMARDMVDNSEASRSISAIVVYRKGAGG